MGMTQARPFFLVLCLMAVSSWLAAQTPPDVTGEKAETVHISLNGSWKLFYFPQGKYQITHPDQLKAQGLAPIEASRVAHTLALIYAPTNAGRPVCHRALSVAS